jgi:hypothetical protein
LSFDFQYEDVLTIEKEEGMNGGPSTVMELWTYMVME